MGVTNAGLAGVTAALIAETYKYLELGSDDTAYAAGQTTLESAITGNGLARADATETQETTTETDDTLQLTHQWTVSGTETVKEAGIFDNSSTGSGTMLARKVLSSSVSLANGDTFTYTYSVICA
jgi:hypothetical protein